MNLEFVKQVGRDHPDLLPANLGHTCYTHTTILIQRLRTAGHRAFLICKSPGEGQYTPPGFQLRTVIGLDGKPYPCSGVSHDAIFFNDRQFDTIGSANEHDRPIYAGGPDGWSFNPADGPRITATAVWNEVPRDKWRNNNPPLIDDTAPAPGPTPVPLPPPTPPAVITFPPRDRVGLFFAALNARYGRSRPNRIDAERIANGDQPLYVDNEGLFVWLSEYMRHYAVDHPTSGIDERHDAAVQAVFDEIGNRV